jgi:tetratricopeptide (TPR) repeat protein
VKPSAPGRKRKAKQRGVESRADKVPALAPTVHRRHLLVLIALTVLTVLAFSNSFQAGFVLDNKGLLLDPRLREATSQNIALIFRHTYWWPTGEAGLYRPITTLSYLFNYAIVGDADQPGGYHWINLILHLGNVCLAYALALRLVRKFWPSVFIAAIWAVHPALTESVTNIVGRADLLAAMAVLSGFLMYLKSRETTDTARLFWLFGLAAVTTIGVFSKESAVAILPLIVLYELVWWKERPQHRALWLGCAATIVPIAAMLYQRSVVLAASPPAEFPFTDNPIVGAGWWTGRLTAIKVIAHYLWLTIWPANLSVDYSYNQIPLVRGSAADWFACLVLLAAAAAVILLYRWNRTCFFLMCFASLNFVPASNLFFPIGTIMADRLLYLPSLGLLGCLVLGIYAAAREPNMARFAPLVLCLIAAGFAVRTWIRNSDWQIDLTLATADVRVSPNSFKLHRLLASSLFEADRSHSNIDQIIAEQDKSLAILDPLPPKFSRPDVYRMAGFYYLLKGDQAREHGAAQNASTAYQRAVKDLLRGISIDEVSRAAYLSRVNPASSMLGEADTQAYFFLSVAYLRLGDADKAYEAINRARTADPLNPQIYRQLSDVFLTQHNGEQASVASMQAGAILALQQEKWQDAATLSDRVLHSDPAGYPAAYYLNGMANLHLGNFDVAEKSAREAVRLDTAHRNPRTNYVLGLILAQKREFRQAAESLQAYLHAWPNAPDAETARKQLDEMERSAREASTESAR